MPVDSKYYIERYKADDSVEYPFEFESIGAEAVEVYVITDGVRTLMPEGMYKVKFGYRDPINTRGVITLMQPLNDGELLQVERATPITNDQIFPPGKPFQSEAFEYAIDKLTFILQELEGSLCDCRETKTTPGYPGDPNDPHDPPGPPALEECVPYACDAIEVFINDSNGWPMTDPEISLTPPADGYFRGGGADLDLTLVTNSTLSYAPPTGLPTWDSNYYHTISGYGDPPGYCVSEPKFASILAISTFNEQCRMYGTGYSPDTITPNFSSTHIMIGSASMIPLDWGCQMITHPNSQNYLLNIRGSIVTSLTNVTLAYRGLGALVTQNMGVPAFDINKPYVVTSTFTAVQAPTGSTHQWTIVYTIKITGFGGTMTHTFSVMEAYAGLGTTATANAGTGYINLFRLSSPATKSLGVLFGDHHNGAWLAIQRNYLSYTPPEYCNI